MVTHRSRNRGVRTGKLFLVVAAAFTAGLAVGWLLQYFPGGRPTAQELLGGENSRTASTKIAAVDTYGNGLLCDLWVEVRPGKGDVYPPVQQLVEVDFQYSQWTAVKVAADYSEVALDEDGIGLEGADVYFSIAPPPGVTERIHIVGGPSAGAAMTILTIAAIENKVIRPDVVITGEILPDGTLGIVGGIFPKAKAAEEDPVVEHFLVPENQPVEVRAGFFWTRYEPISVLIDYAEEEEWRLQIEEIPTIEDAVKVMLS